MERLWELVHDAECSMDTPAKEKMFREIRMRIEIGMDVLADRKPQHAANGGTR